MSPILNNGNFVVTKIKKKFKSNQILLISHKNYGTIVKRLDFIDKRGDFWFKGTNIESVSQDNIGPIKKRQIKGQVVLVISRNEINKLPF